MTKTGHRKTFANTVAKKGHKNIKIKIFMFNCSSYIVRWGHFTIQRWWANNRYCIWISVPYLSCEWYITWPFCVVSRAWGLLLWLGGFDVYSSFWIEQVQYSQKICYKALLRWVPRWKGDSLFECIFRRSDFFLDCLLDVLEVCDNESGVLKRVWLEICRETHLKG